MAGMAGMAERQKEWQNSRMAEMATYVLFMVHTNDDTKRMAEWRNGKIAEWRNCRMVIEWRKRLNGGMAEWRNGGNGGTAERMTE
jgi:hypothetical protein